MPAALPLLRVPVPTDATTGQGTKQNRKDRQARKISAPALLHELPPTIMPAQPLAKTVSAGVAGCVRQELMLTPDRSWIRVWGGVAGRAQDWHNAGFTAHIHVAPQGQAAHCLFARTLPPVSSVSPPHSEP